MSTEPEKAHVDAVVDTNILLDIHSCHDAMESYDKAHALAADAAINDPSVVFRRARARESLLLAIYFNKFGASTHSLHSEAVERLMERAPPAPGGQSMTSDFTMTFVHFVKDNVLPAWNPQIVTPAPGWENQLTTLQPRIAPEGSSSSPRGNAADAWHIAHAKEHGLVLITNEGFGPSGYTESKIAKRARAEGVRTCFPHEIYDGKIDETLEIDCFLRRFREHVPLYLASRKTGDAMGDVLAWVYGYYRLILLGEADGVAEPVQVSIAT